MRRHGLFLGVLLSLLLPGTLLAQERLLRGTVVSLGEHGEKIPEVGATVTLEESGDGTTTDSHGVFRIFLAEIFKVGERVTLQVNKLGWRIQYPLEGEARVPADLRKELVEVRLLPVGSKLFWSHDRIEKFLRDMAEKSTKQVTPDERPIDLSRFIKQWAAKYGFSVREVKQEVDQWIAEVETNQHDFYKLGLAAFARKNFGEASKLFSASAEVKAKKLAAIQQQEKSLTEEVIRDYRLTGDAHYNDYLFEDALSAYTRALSYVSKATSPRLWAGILIEVANANLQIGIRTRGVAVQNNLNLAVAAYRQALEVYTRATLPQDWAMTQNNLGNALQAQGLRTEGKAGLLLLGEVVAAYRQALVVYTRATLPQDWATTQNNLGVALEAQGIRTEEEAGLLLLDEAVAAYRQALEVRTRATLPQDWAQTQTNLGNALQAQGIRTDGEAGLRLLGEAVAAYRQALEVYTRATLAQQWAMTQGNLGIALQNQGIRTRGEAGQQLLGEAVAAYRQALEVQTRATLPQDWARTQNNLGNALQVQGLQTGEEEGQRLLGEAVVAYRQALEVRTREALPVQWAQTHNNLANAYWHLEDWPDVAASYTNVLEVYPASERAYRIASFLYHERLFNFSQAFALNQQWLEQHPDDLAALSGFAEKHFTTGRFADCAGRIIALLEHSAVTMRVQIALRVIEVANLLAMHQAEMVPGKIDKLYDSIASQAESFTISWTFNGVKHVISQHDTLAPYRPWLLRLIGAVEGKDRQAILTALQEVRADFRRLPPPR